MCSLNILKLVNPGWKLLLFLAFTSSTRAEWLSPPAKPVENGLDGINITITGGGGISIYIFENVGRENVDPFPIAELRPAPGSKPSKLSDGAPNLKLKEINGTWFLTLDSYLDYDQLEEHYFTTVLQAGGDIAPLVLTVVNLNDESPQWDSTDYSVHTENLLETLEWGDEGDTSSDAQRNIVSMEFNDADGLTYYSVEASNPDCRKTLPDDVCDEVLSLITVDLPYSIIGRIHVRRTRHKLIDRENRALFDGNSDAMKFLITIFDDDKTNSLMSELTINVLDRNDNPPEFDRLYNATKYSIPEDATEEILIETIKATDKDLPDKYGKVSYVLVDDDSGEDHGLDKFVINLNTGELHSIPGMYNATIKNEYELLIKAVDNYRPDSDDDSLYAIMPITVQIQGAELH